MTELPVHRVTLRAEWIDYNGHLRDAYYALAASEAVDEIMDDLGLDQAYREHTHCTLFTLEMHLHYLREVKITDRLELHSTILDFDAKRIHLAMRFDCAHLDRPAATAEMMLLHVHQGETARSTPFPETTTVRLAGLKASAAASGNFEPGSRKIELKRR